MIAQPVQLILVFISLLPLALARTTQVVINTSWNSPAVPGGPPFAVPDCPNEGPFILQDYADALDLAKSARDVLTNDFRFIWSRRWYEKLFTDKKRSTYVVPDRLSIRDDYDAVYSNSGLPDEIIFHCDPGWRDALYSRRSASELYDIGKPWSGCGAGTQAITTRIRSGDFPPDPDGDFGPNGAFRTGTHITLCPQFFDLKPLGEIAPITAGVRIDDRINRGMVILHELMHAYSRGIRDGGYGYGGCVDVTYNDIASGHDNVKPIGNADTFALFALGVSEVQNMDDWEWTSGAAVDPLN